MKTRGLFFILLSGMCYCQTEDGCTLEGRAKNDIYFPDIGVNAPIAYQMAVDVSLPNSKMTDYYIEYYDKADKKGRVDYFYEADETRKYYYYNDGMEAFEIRELTSTCEEHNETSVPDFMRHGVYEWQYNTEKEKVRGPSAMFRIAYDADRKDHNVVAYMGKSKDVRGISAHYWRRCLRKNITADYYFSFGSREGVYGIKNLTSIPLRVQIYGVDDQFPELSQDLLPQNYEIMTYTPFLDDPYYTFELPVGLGCGRQPREDDSKIPSFGKQSMFIGAEVVYTDYRTAGAKTYISDFMFAYDIESKYLAYFYTPWATTDGKTEAGYPVDVVFDMNNKYVFNTTYVDGRCEIKGMNRFIPKYSLPGGNKGYVLLGDASMFYPNSEFFYLGEGMERGYEVDIFELAYPDGYGLGDRKVKNTVVTHYYLKKDKFKDGPRAVEQALTRIRIRFNGTDEDGRKMDSVLNFNTYVFSTGVADKERTFSIAQCFPDEDDIMFITIAFTAEEAELDQISEDLPSAIQNARTYIKEVAEIPSARVPNVMVDYREALYVTFVIIERPPFQLDFDEPRTNTYIVGATEIEGVTLLPDCAHKCLESYNNCWGFSHCGATCHLGTVARNETKLETKPNCQYFNRTNFQVVPSLRTIRTELERAVKIRQPQLTVAKKGGGAITFTPSYIGDAIFGDSSEIFDLMGMETNSRLRVVKVGFKLPANTGENIGKYFGSLSYGECQRLCLDYKKCETVSYCLSTSECVLSLKHGEDIEATKFVEDNFCNVLTRKYSDDFIRSPGNILLQGARKVLDFSNEEDCAKACRKETSFDCLSFDSCRTSDDKNGCRLHAVHILDLKDKEGAVANDSVCGHYSRKYTYDFKRQSKNKAVGDGVEKITGITVEQCAKYCVEYNNGQCTGFDSCQGKDMNPSCVILAEKVSNMKTTKDAACDHFERSTTSSGDSTRTISNGVAGGVGFLLFVIGCVLGALIVYGVAYYRVNRRR